MAEGSYRAIVYHGYLNMNIQQFDFEIDLLQAILWQYNEAINLQTILKNEENFYQKNHTDFWNDWYNDVFNLQTANDFGLSVWAIILQLPIQLTPPPSDNDRIWGFGQYRKNFENGNFNPNAGSSGLTTTEKRIVLQLRYYQLVCNAAIPNTNRFLNFVFKDLGDFYVLENFNMHITVVIGFNINITLLQFIQQHDLIPRSAGVGIKYIYKDQKVWGFGQYRKNFNNGNFLGDI